MIGAGTMGTGITYAFAAKGCATTVVEPDPARVEALRRTLSEVARDGVARGRLAEDVAAGLPTRTVVLGDSAGGALATAATMVLRGTGYAPAGQVLLYPTLAPVLQRRSPSIDAYGELPSLTRGSIDWFWSHYLRAGQDREPLAVPLRQTDLAGLPPATVVVAGCDLLRDEGLEYAGRLETAGVPTTTHVVAGAIHGFWWMDGVLSQAAELTALLAADLARRA